MRPPLHATVAGRRGRLRAVLAAASVTIAVSGCCAPFGGNCPFKKMLRPNETPNRIETVQEFVGAERLQ